MEGLRAAPGREDRETRGCGVRDKGGQGLTCEEAPQQGSEGTRPSALIQQEEENLPSLKEEATGCDWCARLKRSMNPPRLLSLDCRVDELRKRSPIPGSDTPNTK